MRLREVKQLPTKTRESRYGKLLEEFLESDMTCAELMDEKPVGNTVTAVTNLIRRRGLDIKCVQRHNRAYLVKLIPGTNCPVVGDVS